MPARLPLRLSAACAFGGRCSRASQLLLSQHPSVKPSAQTYAALMRPCEKEGDVSTAKALYDEALTQGFALHIDLFNSFISVCTTAGDFPAAESIFSEMREKV